MDLVYTPISLESLSKLKKKKNKAFLNLFFPSSLAS